MRRLTLNKDRATMDLSLPKDMGPQSGLLNDKQITAAIENGFLFSEESCDVAKVKYATYEIRVSKDYHTVTYRGGKPTFTAEQAEKDEIVIIEPGQTIKVLAKEVFRIPSDIYAKINTVGQIFSAGLAAENTYADPGYVGQIYITLSNISSRRLSIKVGDPLARVEFHKLESPVERPHSGQTGIRKNFVNVESDGKIRDILNSMSVEELVHDMVERSIDEALHDRYIRSEVLIEKAHFEITNLKKLKNVVARLKWLTTAMFFILASISVFYFNVAGILPFNSIVSFIGNIIVSLIASSIFFLIQNKLIK
jgi:deoxycytidine triphosphate deaminase